MTGHRWLRSGKLWRWLFYRCSACRCYVATKRVGSALLDEESCP